MRLPTSASASARAVRPLVWGATLGGFALLLVALLGVVQAAAVLIRRQQQTLSHHAFHDGLTDLPNRALFLDRVGHALARRTHSHIAVLYLNVDGLKLVNDSLGHAAGDRVLPDDGMVHLGQLRRQGAGTVRCVRGLRVLALVQIRLRVDGLQAGDPGSDRFR